MKHGIVILGAGPAGLACAIAAAQRIADEKNLPANANKKNVLLLEKNEIPGKKLLITGTGQCNLTHSGRIEDFFSHYGPIEKARFVKPALLHFDNVDLCSFFKERGVMLEETDGGKIFPRSRKAKEILEVLRRECDQLGVETAIRSGVVEVKIEKQDENNSYFIIRTHKEQICAEHLVLALGGRSYPGTGSTGDGFRFAESLGHGITPIRPALTPIIVRNYRLADCSGVAVPQTRISLVEKNNEPRPVVAENCKTLRSTTGPVLLTHGGISGPGVLDFSRYLAPGDFLLLNWLGNMTPQQIDRQLQNEFAENGKRSLKKNIAACTALPERMIAAMLEQIGITDSVKSQKSSSVEKATRRKIVALLTSYPIQVESLGGFNEAMCTCGGVTLKEVDAKKMRSRIHENLYFCGEVLDIDGDTGGYNLQFAFSSGFLAGETAAQRWNSIRNPR